MKRLIAFVAISYSPSFGILEVPLSNLSSTGRLTSLNFFYLFCDVGKQTIASGEVSQDPNIEV
jgi:hypothetical protein